MFDVTKNDLVDVKITPNRENIILKKNTKSKVFRHLLFFDTETYVHQEKDQFKRQKHEFVFGHAIYNRYTTNLEKIKRLQKTFYKKEDFFKFLFECCKSRQTIYVVAHNMNYDFLVMNTMEYMKDYKTVMMHMKGTSMFIKFEDQKKLRNFIFIDSMNFFQGKLKDLGEEIGLEKGDVDFTHEHTNKLMRKMLDAKGRQRVQYRDSEIKHIVEYCIRDVEIIEKAFEFMNQFLKDNGWINNRPTIGSLSLSIFLNYFYEDSEPMYIHDFIPLLQLERTSYHGGRVEPWFIGTIRERLYKLDFNSLFPSVMAENYFAGKLLQFTKNGNLDFIRDNIEDFNLLANVKIKTKTPCMPVVRDKKLFFPVGTFWTVLSHPELKYAYENNLIVDVKECARYNHVKPFAKFINKLYEKKLDYEKKDMSINRLFIKLILNSSYGKFGQLIDQWEKTGEKYDGVRFGKSFYLDQPNRIAEWRRILDEEEYRIIDRIEHNQSIPIIASEITSYARIKLWMAIEKAGFENFFYCDTDSLFVNKQGMKNLQSMLGDKLGMLKSEGESDETIIFAPKNYVFGDEVSLRVCQSQQ